VAAIAWSPTVAVLLCGSILVYPASGALVGLGQATLMDHAPARREQNMARWNFAGSVGVLLGPLALSGAVVLHLGWRPLFAGLAILAAITVVLVAVHSPQDPAQEAEGGTFHAGVANALRTVRRPEVLRRLALLQVADLLVDVLFAYLALYFVDVVGASSAEAGVAVALWSGAGLLGSLTLIPLLERVSALRYLRGSSTLAIVLFPAFLLAPGFGPKIVLLSLLGCVNAGWYPALKARLYDEMPGQSGAVVAVESIVGLPAALSPLAVGIVAQHVGLAGTMWLLALAPAALLLGLARSAESPEQ